MGIKTKKKRKKKKGSIGPVPTYTLTKKEIKLLLRNGFRIFTEGGIEFIVEGHKHKAPLIEGATGKHAERMPRATWSIDTQEGPSKGQRIELMAWDYHATTVQDFDDIADAPPSLKTFKKAFGYVVTDNGIHIYQAGKQELHPYADKVYEKISREQRGWYGDRIRSRDELSPRTLVTTDEAAAKAWLKAGGRVRLVSDLVRSYATTIRKRGIKSGE